jgi:hypothetical protein
MVVDGGHCYAHVYICQKFHGSVEGLLALHSCDQPSCVNPEHLRWGTAKDNGRDKVIRKRQAYGTRNGSAKLNAYRVQKIKEYDAMGWTSKQIADWYGVALQTVRNVLLGKNWKIAEE